MRRRSRLRPSLAAVTVAALTACTPTAASTGLATPVPSPVPSASPSRVSPLQPGQARLLLERLTEAAGSRVLVMAQVNADEAQIAALVGPHGDQVQTWAWRDGRPQHVDGDTQYIGQSRFDLADFALDRVPEMLHLAAVVAGSAKGQTLQIVESSPGRVLMTVTTQPESLAVFFTPDGELIRPLDFAYPEDLVPGIADATKDLGPVLALGATPQQGVWAERGTGMGTLRQIRPAKRPTRTETRPDPSPLLGWEFDPGVVDRAVLVTLAAEYGKGKPLTFTIDRRDHRPEPVIRLQLEGRTVAFDLAGRDITAHVR